MIYARKKLTKCPNFTRFLPEKNSLGGGAVAPCPPSPTPMIWSVVSQENNWNCCHQMSYFSAPDPAGEAHSVPQDTYLDLRGPTLNEREGRWGEGEEGREKGRGEQWREEEGKNELTHPVANSWLCHCPRPPPGLCPWTPIGDFRPPDPHFCPYRSKFLATPLSDDDVFYYAFTWVGLKRHRAVFVGDVRGFNPHTEWLIPWRSPKTTRGVGLKPRFGMVDNSGRGY